MMLVKEELVTYLTMGHVHVSRQDYQFFSNLIKINMQGNITTGQDKLLNKLVDKYKRQLVKLGHDVEHLKKLKWKNTVIETQEEYKSAYLSIEDDKLIFKSPFSKKFITDLRNEADNNTFTWNKARKVYISDATTIALKTILKVSNKCFTELKLCNQLENIVTHLNSYEKSVWNPTLYKVNGNYVIIACSLPLYDAISDVELNNDPKTLFNLTKFGIQVDQSVIDNELQKFASSFYYETDTSFVYEIINYLKQLGIDRVRVETQTLYSNTLYKELGNKLIENGITIVSNNELQNLVDNEYPILISFKTKKYLAQYSKGVSKIISIKNSTPIHIK